MSFDDQVWQGKDSITWTRGHHTFKFGGQYFQQIVRVFLAGNNGELGYMNYDGRFSSSAIGSSSGGAGGDGAAEFSLAFPMHLAEVSAREIRGDRPAISLPPTPRIRGSLRTALR